MSQADKVNDMKIEIQKLLGEINKDMNKLKTELVSLNHIVEVDASLPMNVKMVNERLMVAAKEAGIDLGDLETEASEEETSQQNESQDNVSQQNASQEDDSEREDNTQESPSDQENAASLAAAANKLTKKVKRTLR